MSGVVAARFAKRQVGEMCGNARILPHFACTEHSVLLTPTLVSHSDIFTKERPTFCLFC
jgi:hypothetical protein